MASFNWIENLSLPRLKWIVKLDDDIIFNLNQLDQYLSSPNVTRNGEKFIHCKINNGIPMRDINQKWYIFNIYKAFFCQHVKQRSPVWGNIFRLCRQDYAPMQGQLQYGWNTPD